MFPYTDEEIQIRKMVRDFMENEIAPNVDEWEEKCSIPRSIFKQMADLGLAGMSAPEELGGTDLDNQSKVIIAEEIGRIHRAIGYIFIHSMVVGIICEFGSEEQKERFVRPMVDGEKLACFCLTEPGAGSDAGAITARAVKDGDNYILNGTKVFITNGDVADIYFVAAKTKPEAGARGVSLFIVERGTKGLSVPKNEDKLGIKATNISEVVLDDCVVPAANLLGNVENKGFAMLMDGLETGRMTNAGQAVGIAQGAYEIALKYATEREAFGGTLADLQVIQFMLADMATEIEAARLLTYKAAWLKDQGLPAARYCSMAKRYAADTAMKVTTDCVQILGAYGYVKDYKVERYFRDAKGAQMVEGTSQIQRVIVWRDILKEFKK